MKRPLEVIAAIGLALGGIFGLAGTLVAQPYLRAACWAIDGTALVVAAAVLSVRYFRKGCDSVAAGFLVFAVGEGVMLSGVAGTLADSVPSFAAGTALWAAALLLISIPGEFAVWARMTGIVGAILFAITAGEIFWGYRVFPTASPLPRFAYPFLVLTFVGWIWALRSPRVA